MRENYIQTGKTGTDQRLHIAGDWYPYGMPANVRLADNVYIDTSYGFAAFHSNQPDAISIDEASGCYDRASFVVGENGKISVGKYCVLNGSTIICKEQITIGNHCMLAWGTVLTDSWMDASSFSLKARRVILEKAAADPLRRYPFAGSALPIVLEDNCWVGFDAVILPGVRLGEGCVVGCKAIVDRDVPPYAVVAGSPAKIVKYLAADDMGTEKNISLEQYLK
jgi:acetyltransferase-like isoleucine patch superfamily enzyme